MTDARGDLSGAVNARVERLCETGFVGSMGGRGEHRRLGFVDVRRVGIPGAGVEVDA
jgi:hypothetical protein